jgi:hypothetical protein
MLTYAVIVPELTLFQTDQPLSVFDATPAPLGNVKILPSAVGVNMMANSMEVQLAVVYQL